MLLLSVSIAVADGDNGGFVVVNAGAFPSALPTHPRPVLIENEKTEYIVPLCVKRKCST